MILSISLNHGNGQGPTEAKARPKDIPEGAEFFNGKWYKVFNEKRTWQWQEARKECESKHGQLAVVPDTATWEFLKKRVQKAVLWLGAEAEKTPGTWRWIDGTPFLFQDAWRGGEPNNAEGKECYMATLDGSWNDVAASGKFPGQKQRVTGFVCEWKDK